MRAPFVLILALAFFAPRASAGSQEAPELTDAENDCAVPYGNSYLDIVSAWISDETPTEFKVNLGLREWVEPIAEGSGFTVQFTHQGVQWGIIASFGALADGWSYTTGHYKDNQVSGFNETTGTFTAGTPAVLSVTFPKGIFPHTDVNDNALTGFTAASADLRPAYPFFIAQEEGAPVDSNGRWIVCDEASSNVAYTFGSGAHSQHGTESATAANATASGADPAPASAAPGGPTGGGPNASPPPAPAEKATPAPALPGVVGGLAVVAFAMRRRAR